MSCPLIVLKFGGSVLRDEARLRIAVHEIYRWRRDGYRVVAVVSALQGRTDELLARCQAKAGSISPHATAAMASIGEHESAALLGVLLDRAGIPARTLTPSALELLATGDPLDADPVSLDTAPITRGLESDGVVVVPGYAAIDEQGRTVVLGRGGSDLTALLLAGKLGADKCRLLKDVDGLYERDPAKPGPRPRRFDYATFDDALATDGSIVQHKALRFAKAANLPFELGRCNHDLPSHIGGDRSELRSFSHLPRRITVGLLGCGTVGRGVLELLGQMPEWFSVEAIAVRNPESHIAAGVPAHLLQADAGAVANAGFDVVIEAIGGTDVAGDAVRAAFDAGSHIVTANKALIAEQGDSLAKSADRLGRRLLYSAAVGGSTPAAERVGTGLVRQLRGVLNGSANYVLNELDTGKTLDEAIAEATAAGFTEADPMRDLDGRDSLDKLIVLAKMAGLPTADLARECEPITAKNLSGHAGKVRHVATLSRESAIVRLETIDEGDALFDLPGEWNQLEIERDDGSIETVRGRGAGRWPTAESVVADLLGLAREKQTQSVLKLRREATLVA